MTREQAKDLFRLDTDAYGKPKAVMTKINNIYDGFEREILKLQATIEAQEIIIKDKSAIMEAMAQPKTCETCKHCITTHSIITSTPICGHDENIQFYLDDQPMQTSEGFYCNRYEPKAQL